MQRSAETAQQDIQEYCNMVSSKFYQLFESSDISFTNYNRTTDVAHKKAVQAMWNLLQKNGYIYKASYCGYYSVSDESFVPESRILTKGDGTKVSAETGQPLEWHEEENYMFRLSSLQNELVDWIENCLVMKPDNFHVVLKHEIQNANNLNDISISRSKSRLKWGIEVPGDDSQVIYVWFDALVNYLTASGFPGPIRQWPPAHLIGQDILKFHGIYWPAFLIAAQLEPPRLIYCHAHWLYEEQKMSKSKGNVVDPNECIEKFTSDGIRFFLLKEGTPHSNSSKLTFLTLLCFRLIRLQIDFSLEKVKITLNADLANTFGNLLNRCTSLKLNSRQQFPNFELDYIRTILPEANEIIDVSGRLAENCYHAYLNGSFYIGISQIMDFLRLVNGLITATQPWNLVNSPNDQDRLNAILYIALEAIRVSSILLEPVIPRTSQGVFDKLNIAPELRTWKSAENAYRDVSARNAHNLNATPYILFSKLH